jgi:hypothetical protein
MKLPTFLFASSPDMPGAGIVISTTPPFFIAQVLLFKTEGEFSHFLSESMPAIGSRPIGYRIILIGTGSLLVPSQSAYIGHSANELSRIYREMADYYLTSKIKINEGYYRRYRSQKD